MDGAAAVATAPRLKVAQVVTRMDVGGVPDHVVTLSVGLARHHDVTVVCASIDPRHAETLARAGVAVAHVGFERLLAPRCDVRAFRALLALLKARRFDVVHTHMSKAALLGGVAATTAGTPAVVNTAHNLGFLALPQPALRAAFWLYDKLLFRLTMHRIITVSEGVRDRVTAGRLTSVGTTVAIHNGVLDGGRFKASPETVAAKRAEFGAASGAVMILSVARLVWFKGLDALVAALPAVLDKHPDARVVIAGAGELLDDLRAQARALGVADAITFAGERADVPELLAASDVFVLPSVSEGLPISILEAMTAGKPVVATSVGGVPELVADGETGLLVPDRDAAALSRALVRLADDAALRARMGAAGRARVAASFSADAMVARTAALYREILDERRAGRPR